MNIALWIAQGLLAAVFLFAGGMKLILPVEEMTKEIPLPGFFLRFVAVCEVLGAIGLILPGLLRIRPGLTALAATGLVFIMIGATGLTLATGNITTASIPLVVGLLAAFVAYGRWRLAPLGKSARSRTADSSHRPLSTG
jgi:hypothetical protein